MRFESAAGVVPMTKPFWLSGTWMVGTMVASPATVTPGLTAMGKHSTRALVQGVPVPVMVLVPITLMVTVGAGLAAFMAAVMVG
jgi:hypothetical protein